MFALGVATTGHFSVFGYVSGQAMVSAAQITAHYINEYADLEADKGVVRRTFFSGGSGVLVSGALPRHVAIRAGWVTTSIALSAAAVLATRSVAAAVLGVAALTISWAYSMQPVRLLGTGWGELATSLVVAGAVPAIGALAQAPAVDMLSTSLWWAIAILVPLHIAMMLSFELPDIATDSRAGKRVIAVRIGRTATSKLIVILVAVAAVLVGVAGLAGGIPPGAAYGALGATPAALATLVAMRKGRNHVLTAAAVATFVSVGVALVLGVGL